SLLCLHLYFINPQGCLQALKIFNSVHHNTEDYAARIVQRRLQWTLKKEQDLDQQEKKEKAKFSPMEGNSRLCSNQRRPTQDGVETGVFLASTNASYEARRRRVASRSAGLGV